MSKKINGTDPSIELEKLLKPYGNGKNVLLIMADEFRFPIHKNGGGMIEEIKNVLGFQNVGDENEENCISQEIKDLFPGFMKLRNGATVLQNHTVATTACVPSRAALFTGQYGSRNKVTQTDGVFKGASENGFKWLKPNGVPTIGHWYRENNYTTHYFGKCHFAHPKKQSLKRWGFDDWDTSFPEPHGTLKNNLGMYRDHGFTDLITTFLRRKGMALDYDQEVGRIEMEEFSEKKEKRKINNIKKKPWFAVASFTNPHDITTWPVLPSQAEGKRTTDLLDSLMNNDSETESSESLKKAQAKLKITLAKIGHIKPLDIPEKNKKSSPPEQGTWTFDMNPGGIKQDCAILPNSWNESLLDKPDCQFDYSLKLGIALASKTGKQIIANNAPELNGMPFPLTEDPELWTTAYIQYYTYLHHLLDEQINKVLLALDESGLRDDTIVLFIPDHGEYGGSHGKMMQKWHTAYQEAIHVPVVVSMPENVDNSQQKAPTPITELTSHIDILPTLLGLTGIKGKGVKKLEKNLSEKHKTYPFVGADLSDLITGKTDKIVDPLGLNKEGRDSILFTTSDMITEPVKKKINKKEEEKNKDYEIFKRAVGHYIRKGEKDFKTDGQYAAAARMKPDSIVQPAEVHCIRENNWKLVRYRDYHNPKDESVFQWELYDLSADPGEENNLLKYKTKHSLESGIRFESNPSILNSKDGVYNPKFIVGKASELYQKMLIMIENMIDKPKKQILKKQLETKLC